MNKVVKFVKEAINELGNVTWPTRPLVFRLTIGVLIVAILFSIFVGVVDVGITKGLQGLVVFLSKEKQSSSYQTSPIEISPEDIQVEATTVE